MKGGMLPFCIAVALACDLPRSHAGVAPIRAHVLHAALMTAEESIVGRARVGGRFLLLTSDRRLIAVEEGGGASARRLDGFDTELWSLAPAADGTLWTLAGRDTLMEIVDGRAARRLALDGAYAGVHAGPGFLLYQPYDFRVGSPALLRGEPAVVGEPAGQLRVAGGAGSRVAAWMKSLVQCGFVSNGRIPCWPVGGAVVDVIDSAGTGLLVRLDGLEPRHDVSGEEFAERARPVLQDVALDRDAALWVLASDAGAPVVKERGVRDLWRFSLAGRRLERHRLTAPVRMLIAAGRDRLLAISGSGDLVRLEVK
jgi:hypothetical protein